MTEIRGDPPPEPPAPALFTDLYELTMAQAYHAEGMEDRAAFELFFRELPAERNYIVAAGLEDVLAYLETVRFTESDLEYLRRQGQFSEEFLAGLRDFRFGGDVWAVPEGTPVFGNEPLVRVEAPVLQAQLVETFVLNQVHFQSVIAAKAARVVEAARGRNVVDFGSRRAHGADAAVKAARAAYLVGAAGTSNVQAGKLYGIEIFGTMAHSYVQAHDNEAAALRAFAELYPGTTLLVDTYDTPAGVRKAIDVIRRQDGTRRAGAIRLDSGDLTELAVMARRMLDEAGLDDVKIFASSGLDEHKIAAILDAGGPVDGFGVGTRLVVSPDAPDLDMAYKLVAYAGRPRMKLSTDKELYPGCKQVFRVRKDRRAVRDILACWGEEPEGLAPDEQAEPLLQPAMRAGKRVKNPPRLADSRAYFRRCRESLPDTLRRLEPADPRYLVEPSERLRSIQYKLTASLRP